MVRRVEQAVEEFVSYLERRGRGSYTARSYRLGLIDFAGWLAGEGIELDAVSKAVVETYVDRFARGVDRDGRPRAARTVNHRLSVLASFFGYLIEHDTDHGGAWAGRTSPVPAVTAELTHGIGGGGSAPPRRLRAELRRREPREEPKVLGEDQVASLIEAARSRRDKAILTLLSQSGQRIGDWSAEHGRHGILGLRLSDLDRRRSAVVVLLKGARDQHRVPVTDTFWTAFDAYLAEERRGAPNDAAWVGLRRGWPEPLTYGAFEAALRALSARTGIPVTAHMFRHTVATRVVASAGVAVAQQLLGHAHIATTVDTYAHVDHQAMAKAVAEIERQALAGEGEPRYAFHYSPSTLAELEAVTAPRHAAGDAR